MYEEDMKEKTDSHYNMNLDNAVQEQYQKTCNENKKPKCGIDIDRLIEIVGVTEIKDMSIKQLLIKKDALESFIKTCEEDPILKNSKDEHGFLKDSKEDLEKVKKALKKFNLSKEDEEKIRIEIQFNEINENQKEMKNDIKALAYALSCLEEKIKPNIN